MVWSDIDKLPNTSALMVPVLSITIVVLSILTPPSTTLVAIGNEYN